MTNDPENLFLLLAHILRYADEQVLIALGRQLRTPWHASGERAHRQKLRDLFDSDGALRFLVARLLEPLDGRVFVQAEEALFPFLAQKSPSKNETK